MFKSWRTSAREIVPPPRRASTPRVAVIYGGASAALPIVGTRLNQTGGCADGVFYGGDTDSGFLLPLGLSNVVALFVLTRWLVPTPLAAGVGGASRPSSSRRSP